MSQSGELIVTGTNSLTITLDSFPSSTKVKFKDEHHEHAPCDPGNVDYVSCDAHVSNTVQSGFVLIIQWSVSSVREIVWHVYY